MAPVSRLAIAVAAGVALSCQSSPMVVCGADGICLAGSGPVALDRYCALRAAVTCRAMPACCPPAGAMAGARCEAVERADCEAELAERKERLRRIPGGAFDAAAAGDCLRAMARAGQGCRPPASTPAEVQGLAACGRLWTPVGEECFDHFCPYEPGRYVGCQIPSEGASPYCRRETASTRGGPCEHLLQCENGLHCDEARRVCAAPSTTGAPCRWHSECASGVCSERKTCAGEAAPLFDGERCRHLADRADTLVHRGVRLWALALGPRDLFWLEGDGGGATRVMSMPRDGGAVVRRATIAEGTSTRAMAEHAGRLILRQQDAVVLRIDEAGGQTRIALPPPPEPNVLVRDVGILAADDQAAYFADEDCHRVWEVRHDETVARARAARTGTAPAVARTALALTADAILCGSGPRIFRVARATGAITIAADGHRSVGAVAAGGSLFFADDRKWPPARNTAGEIVEPLPWTLDEIFQLAPGGTPVPLEVSGGTVGRLLAAGGHLCWTSLRRSTDPLRPMPDLVVCRRLDDGRSVVVDDRGTEGADLVTDGTWIYWSIDTGIRRARLP